MDKIGLPAAADFPTANVKTLLGALNWLAHQ
jgi:hypothetical protein